MEGNFVPDCNLFAPGGHCEIIAIEQPTNIDELGYTLSNSRLQKFSFSLYLGGRDTIDHNLFTNMNQSPGSAANGRAIYSDLTYVSIGTNITQNVFMPPYPRGAIMIQGRASDRGIITDTTVADNLIAQTGGSQGLIALTTTRLVVKNNFFYNMNANPNPNARAAIGFGINKVDDFQVTGNTFWGWGPAINFRTFGEPGAQGSSNGTIAFNRFYNNRFGLQAGPASQPITNVTANDNWWGSNGGPGSTGHRTEGEGFLGQPVNGVQFDTGPTNVIPGIAVDTWLHLTCRVHEPVHLNEPATVEGQVLGMPTLDSSVDIPATRNPWFFDRQDPLMFASSDRGDVYGFGQVPNEGTATTNALLTGTLIASHLGKGEFLVDLDSEQVACPVDVGEGPDPGLDKSADNGTVPAGGLAGFTVKVTNRGRRAARNWWVCDSIPRRMSFASASVRMRRLGAMRCLVIPRLRPHQRISFHITLHVGRDASGTEENVEEIIPGPPGGGDPTVPGDEGKPPKPPATGEPPHYRPIERDTAAVRVVRPTRRPGFTG